MLNGNTICDNTCTYPVADSKGGGLMLWPGTSASGTDNIFYDNSAYIDDEIHGNASFTYTCVSSGFPGTGNISSNPSFVNQIGGDYNLNEGSPCIDTGNPNSPLDPDNTRADMGALYFNQAGAPPLSVTLTPSGMPIVIPANGGTISFNISLANTGATVEQIDIWTMVTLPNGSEYGPLINFPYFNINPGWSGGRDRLQAIPASAPVGNYTYDAYIGDYPGNVIAEDHFDFSKSAAVDNIGSVVNWNSSGESFDRQVKKSELLPETCDFLSAYPNPFNPSTTLSFVLGKGNWMTISVFDATGREIAVLCNEFKPAGEHQVIFNSEGLSSGLYFAVLNHKESTTAKKLLLLK